MTSPQPSVGRIVHFVAYSTAVQKDGAQAFESVCRAAVVTQVHGSNPDLVGLCVMDPTGVAFHGVVLHIEDHVIGNGAGTWHWPERV